MGEYYCSITASHLNPGYDCCASRGSECCSWTSASCQAGPSPADRWACCQPGTAPAGSYSSSEQWLEETESGGDYQGEENKLPINTLRVRVQEFWSESSLQLPKSMSGLPDRPAFSRWRTARLPLILSARATKGAEWSNKGVFRASRYCRELVCRGHSRNGSFLFESNTPMIRLCHCSPQ